MLDKRYFLTASLICADPINLERDIKELESSGIDYLHFDVMDGLFVPRYGLYPELLKKIKTITKLPIDVHMMVANPEPYLESFAEAGADIISVHVEGNNHLHRTLSLIKKLNVRAGVVINPATPLSCLDYIIDEISLVMLMAINPGIVGHGLIPSSLEKLKDLKEKLRNRPDMLIEVDGGVTFDSSVDLLKNGANMLVCGSSTIFKDEYKISYKVRELKNLIDNEFFSQYGL
jgi:ribulose-phosphate 3-epimerase